MSTVTHDMSAQMYLKVFLVLIGLTVLTFLQPHIISGTISETVMIQLFIATIKAVLIGSYYMHLKYEVPLFRWLVYVALIVLAIFFIITASDAVFRNETYDLFQKIGV
jgi:cytochrome c oxidase subunit IV